MRDSKARIFSVRQERPAALPRGFFALLPALALVILGGFWFFHLTQAPGATAYGSLKSDDLSREVVAIGIELREVNYGESAERVVALAITEISADRAAHLNPDILRSELDLSGIEESGSPEIDRLLNSVIF